MILCEDLKKNGGNILILIKNNAKNAKEACESA
jgi:hypothetical protein